MPPPTDIANELRAMSARVEELRSLMSMQAAASSEMPPSSPELLFARSRVIYGAGEAVPAGGCILWPYNLPVPDGWEEAVELRGLYVVGHDPNSDDYSGIGHGNNISGFTGYDYHGDGDGISENNHANHNLNHSHQINQSSAPSVGGGYVNAPGSPGWCSSLTVAGGSVSIPGCTEGGDGGGIEWCDPENGFGAGESSTGHSLTDNRPRTFVAKWIRKLPNPQPPE